MEEKKKIGFSYGCMSDSLEEQAKKQGFTLDGGLGHDKIKDSINTLLLHGIATDSQVKIMTSKLHKKVMKDLKKYK